MYGDDEYDVSLGISRRISADSSASMLTSSLAAFRGDVLVLESGSDEVIPHGVIDVYLRACPQARHVTIPDATHALTRPEWRKRFVQEILAFFRKL
jgi:pimeloyl-ACP methyl ester carboxylesterase